MVTCTSLRRESSATDVRTVCAHKNNLKHNCVSALFSQLFTLDGTIKWCYLSLFSVDS